MTREKSKPNATKHDLDTVRQNSLASLLTPCLAHTVGLCDKETEALLALGKVMTEPLLASLSKRCADIYEVHDHMQALLDDDRYQECHHVLLLLYAACREAALGCVALVACYEEMLAPYMWGVMSAMERYLDEQDELYRREDAHDQ